jgi:hypothetical protein
MTRRKLSETIDPIRSELAAIDYDLQRSWGRKQRWSIWRQNAERGDDPVLHSAPLGEVKRVAYELLNAPRAVSVELLVDGKKLEVFKL